jgi:hypothetical protein
MKMLNREKYIRNYFYIFFILISPFPHFDFYYLFFNKSWLFQYITTIGYLHCIQTYKVARDIIICCFLTEAEEHTDNIVQTSYFVI